MFAETSVLPFQVVLPELPARVRTYGSSQLFLFSRGNLRQVPGDSEPVVGEVMVAPTVDLASHAPPRPGGGDCSGSAVISSSSGIRAWWKSSRRTTGNTPYLFSAKARTTSR